MTARILELCASRMDIKCGCDCEASLYYVFLVLGLFLSVQIEMCCAVIVLVDQNCLPQCYDIWFRLQGMTAMVCDDTSSSSSKFKIHVFL